MKCHVSHDIVLLCLKCHARSNELDYLRRAELADQYQAPIGNENLVKANLEDKSRRTARSAGNALLKNYEKIPEKRRIELENTLAQYFNVDFSQELIQLASDLPVTVKGTEGDEEEFLQHGQKIVSKLEEEGIEALKDFEVSWRKHFLEIMKPKYMPDGWDLFHNHERIQEKTEREENRKRKEIEQSE